MDSAFLSWGEIIGDFSQAHKVFAPDLPGFGLSDKPSIPYTIDYYTQFLHRFLQIQGLTSCSLIGLSMGGHLALNFTLKYPEKVTKLVLVSCAGLGTKLRWQILAQLMVKMPKLHSRIRRSIRRYRRAVKWILRNVVHNPKSLTDSLFDQILEADKVPGVEQAWRSYVENEMSWTGFTNDLLDRLKRVDTPTFLVHGANDKLVPLRWATKAHRLIPASHIHVLEYCGHWPQRERPDEFTQVVSRFLSDSTP